MSLTSILKQIERVNQKHRQVEKRYNRKSKGCPRQQDLEKEELEDKRIYGYSHSQILQMFKQNKSENNQQTRPCTAVQTRPFVSDSMSKNTKNRHNLRRVHSAVKVGSYKQQYNFLFKEDIFDQNYEKTRYTSPMRDQENQRKISKMFVSNTNIPKSIKKMHSKSIKAERINFIKSFDQNLKGIQNKNKKKLIKTCKNSIFYPRKKQSQKMIANTFKQGQDFFKLTKAIQRQIPKKLKVNLSMSLDNLKQLQSLITKSESKKSPQFKRQAQFGKYLPLMDTNFVNYLPNKCFLTCIVMDNLQSVRFRLLIKNTIVILQQSKEVINISNIFTQLLANNNFIHVIFHTQKKDVIYQQILVSQSFKSLQTKQHEIILLMYYLKRFLLFDEQTKIKSIQQSADLLLKSNIDLPDDFIDFIETFQNKMCRIYDKDQRLYQFNLKLTLNNALFSINAFKKQMGFGQKAVKLKYGTREDFKKYLYNWEYFYICFFLFINELLFYFANIYKIYLQLNQ